MTGGMKVIGITGPSGAGKGAFSALLADFGIPCIDTDQTARAVVEKGKPCLCELTARFGNEILLPDGTLDRKKLGGIAFSDEEAHRALNEITHKYITAEVHAWLDAQCAQGHAVAGIDAPLLFESGENALCDVTVAVLSDEKTRLARVLARDGITPEYAKKRLASQKSDAFFLAHCDHIIYNNGSKEALHDAARAFLLKFGFLLQ